MTRTQHRHKFGVCFFTIRILLIEIPQSALNLLFAKQPTLKRFCSNGESDIKYLSLPVRRGKVASRRIIGWRVARILVGRSDSGRFNKVIQELAF